MRILVNDVDHLNTLINHLKSISGVHGVERTGI